MPITLSRDCQEGDRLELADPHGPDSFLNEGMAVSVSDLHSTRVMIGNREGPLTFLETVARPPGIARPVHSPAIFSGEFIRSTEVKIKLEIIEPGDPWIDALRLEPRGQVLVMLPQCVGVTRVIVRHPNRLTVDPDIAFQSAEVRSGQMLRASQDTRRWRNVPAELMDDRCAIKAMGSSGRIGCWRL